MAAKSNPLEWMNEGDYAAFNAKRFEREFAADPALTQFSQDQENDALELQQHASRQVDRTSASVEFTAFAEPGLNDFAQTEERELEDELLARTPDEIPLDERIADAPRMWNYPIPQQPAQEFGITAAGLQQPVPGATTQEVGPQAAPLVPGGPPPSPGDILGFVGNAVASGLNLGAEQSERLMGILADTGLGRVTRSVVPSVLKGGDFQPGLSLSPPRPLDPDISGEVATVRAQLESKSPGIADRLEKTIGHSMFANQDAKLGAFRDTLELIEEIQAWEISEFSDPSLIGEWNENINPNWADKTLQDFADVRSARFESKLQDITDKHGIAWAEILGNVFIDPLNLVGFGLLGKLPFAGKALGTAERLYLKAASKPFELAGKGITKTVGLGLKTRIDKTVANVAGLSETYFTGKGQLLTDDVTATDEFVRLVAGKTGAKLPAEYDDLQRVFDADVHNALPELLKGLTPAEAVQRITQYHRATVQALVESTGLNVGRLSDKGIDAMGREIKPETIRGHAEIIDGLLEQQGMIRQVLKAVPKPSWATRPLGMAGTGARIVNDQAIDRLHRGVNLPFARAQLIFAAYAPFNYLETLAFSMLNGAKPGLVSADVYDVLRQVDSVIPAIGGKRAPAVGFSRQTAIADTSRGDPVSRFFQKVYENLDGTIDGGLRRNTAVEHIEQGISSDAVLREAAESIRKEIYAMLPESLRNEAHNLAQAAAIWGLRRPKSLPQLADQFLLPKIKERAANSLVLDYAAKADLPPEALQAVVDYTGGKIRTIDGLQTKIDSILEGRVVDKVVGDIDVADDMAKHLDGMADRALAEGGEYLTDFLTARRFVRIQLNQSLRRLMAAHNQSSDIAKELHQWEKVDKIWRVDNRVARAKIRSTLDSFKEAWERVVAKDPTIKDHRLANTQIDGDISEIVTRYMELDDDILGPVREAASLTKGQKAKGAAWNDYFRQRRALYAKQDKEIDELIAGEYPEFRAMITGTQAAPPGFGQIQAKFGQVSVEMRSQANNLIADVEGLNSLKAAPEDVQRLRQGLEDLAATLPEEHADRMADVISDAAQRTQKSFINYPGNSLDGVARVADPFWIYQSRRLPRIAEEAVRHPGMYNLYEDYFGDSERGYLTSDAFGRYQWDLTRGSILSLIAAGRRRGNVIDIEALSRGEFRGALRGDRFPERYDGFFGQVEKAQELLSAIGIYPGAVIELAIMITRGIGLAKEGKAGFFEAAELGNLIPPPVSLAINALEIAGVDTAGFHKILRDPFHDRAVKLAEAEIVQRRQTEGLPALDEPELRKQARKQAAKDELVSTQTGAVRIRSSEELERQSVADGVMADRRGITEREYREQRVSPDHQPPDALDRMAVNEAWGRMLNGTPLDGSELRSMISSANQELRPLELRQLAEKVEEKREATNIAREKFQPVFDKAVTDLNRYGIIREFNLAGTVMKTKTLNELYKTYFSELQTIDALYAGMLPTTSAEWDQVAAQYGTSGTKRGALDSALRLFRDIQPEQERFKLWTGEPDWDEYFQAREDFLAGLTSDVRAQIEALTLQRDALSDLPFRQEVRLAGRLRREMYEQPKYFYFQPYDVTATGDLVYPQNYTIWPDDIQNKLETVEQMMTDMSGEGPDGAFATEAAAQSDVLQQAWLDAGKQGPMPVVTKADVIKDKLRNMMTTRNPSDEFLRGRPGVAFDNLFREVLPTGEESVIISDVEELNRMFEYLSVFSTAKRLAGQITTEFRRQLSPRNEFQRKANRDHMFPGSTVGVMEVVYGGTSLR